MTYCPGVLVDSHAEHLASDEWFRLASAPATYRYDCSVNFLFGVECTVFIDRVETAVFPWMTIGCPRGESSDGEHRTS